MGTTQQPPVRSQSRASRGSNQRKSDAGRPETEAETHGPVVESMVREVCGRLNADAITIAFREDGGERLLVCTRDGDVRAAAGSISLGLISRGPTRLKGGAGLLQAVECRALLGFVPCSYLGAPFKERNVHVRGGVAAWSRRPRRWGASEGTLVRKLAAFCLDRM